jgi:NifB/MoaA-like Fe-S oxidoreductase
VYPIVNEFFGPDITVSGLLTGRDMLAQLRGQPLGAKVIVPGNVLRAGDDVLLDDMSLPQLSQSLGTPVEAAKDPWDLLERVRA